MRNAVTPAHRSGNPNAAAAPAGQPTGNAIWDPAAALAPASMPAAGAGAAAGGQDQNELRTRAVNLFTFLRELVSLRTTVVRNLESYDRVLWINDVPRDADCDCIAFRPPKPGGGGEEDERWLEVRKPVFTEPPAIPELLAGRVNIEKLKDSAPETPDAFSGGGAAPAPAVTDDATATGTTDSARAAWEIYLAQQWRPWAADDRRKRKLLSIYTDLFSLYQQQNELGEAYEVVVGLGQLRWAPAPGVEVNRHVVVMQTSIEFDTRKGVITIGPAAEGAKPRLEEDMLELDERPSPDLVTSLEQQVATCGEADDDDAWRCEQITGALKSFVHSLGNGQGGYAEELAPVDRVTDVPQVRWAPAVILRRRTEQGLLQVYGKIMEDLKKCAEVPEGLVPLVEIASGKRDSRGSAAAANREAGDEAVAAAAKAAADDLLFPLHFNDEQRQIVNRLQRQCGVVVQGPPGTGKSHTIANLVCHLLATGNRVLVTSHAPRALRILKEKIPQEITNMCVVLLGNDRTALTELEASVQVITQQLNAWDPRTRADAIRELETQLATLRGRAAEVDGNLRAFRESDTHPHPAMPGGYEGTLQAIALTLRGQEPELGWIGQYAQGMEVEQIPEAGPGVSDAEALELLKGLRSVDARRRKELERELPAAGEAMTAAELERLVDDEQQWRAAADQARAATVGEPPVLPSDLDADEHTLKELGDVIDSIVKALGEMDAHYFSWVPKMGRDVRAGQYEQWKLLLDKTRPMLEAIKQQPEHVYEQEVINLGTTEIGTLRADTIALERHLNDGGKLWKFFKLVGPAAERKYIFSDVKMSEKRIKSEEMVKDLRAWAEVQFQLHELAQLWSGAADIPQGPVVRRLVVWNERCAIIEAANQLNQTMQRARDLFARLPGVTAPAWHDGEKLRLVQKQIRSIFQQKAYDSRKAALNALAEQATRRAASANAHPVTGMLADAMKRRDVTAYRAADAELTALWAERESWQQCSELLKKLAERLPKAAKALSDDPTDGAWDERMAHLNDAWLWLRADRWLKRQLDPRHFEHLQSERKGLQEHIQSVMVKIAAAKAWYHCMERMTPAEETYLKAWVQAVRNIGAGSGKRANRFRRVARQTLERCRTAIPAWIMPIHRLAETVMPGEDLFDVVIVDEASQSGAEALFLHYIAKKIIIVGDDKQIAPYNVGINRDDVELLRSRHIKDLPLSDYFDLEHSFFDQAYLRFGNRIRLCEHFRCMPEIIQFSNKLCYSNEPLLPLRQYGDGRVEPVVVAKHVASGKMEGTSPLVVNKAEGDAIVKQIAKLVEDPTYDGKTFGVISLLGEKQARYIESKLLATIGPEEMERRRLICGDAYSFQGDERHVMFISLVVAADEGRRMATLTQAADERRFNVAASRARDQMWLFHSVMPDDLPVRCLRRALLEYCLHPQVPQDAGLEPAVAGLERVAGSADRARVPAPPPFESWLEVDVYLELRKRGYRVLAQHTFAGYKIDLVVTGTHARLAVECDGEDWQGQDRYDGDMNRQRQLERCGWRFWRVRGGAFYRNPEAALRALWEELDKQGIRPAGAGDEDEEAVKAKRATKAAPDDEDADKMDEAEEDSPEAAPKPTMRKRAAGGGTGKATTAKRTTRRASAAAEDDEAPSPARKKRSA